LKDLSGFFVSHSGIFAGAVGFACDEANYVRFGKLAGQDYVLDIRFALAERSGGTGRATVSFWPLPMLLALN
jgi:hypothetical protein